MEFHSCPRCKEVMLDSSTISGAVSGYRCSRCHGVFLPGISLEKLEAKTQFTLYEKKTIPDNQAQKKGMFCPRCIKKIMLKKRSTIDRSVLMDVCPECEGVWLDTGELDAIVTDNILDILRRALV